MNSKKRKKFLLKKKELFMSFKQSRYFVCKLNFDYAGKN